ncbi:MAG: serine acetyltransferase [Thermoguttaceae bacterium]|nr:serine acetyltransferase [Thermoguttaceae bacterium]
MIRIPLENQSELSQLTTDIVSTYVGTGGISHLDACPLPNYESVIAAAEAVKEILYPGYRRRDGLHLGNVIYHVGELLDTIYDRLVNQISRAVCHHAGQNSQCSAEKRNAFEAIARQKTLAFLQCIPDLRRVLATDVEAAYKGDPACQSTDEVIFCYPGLEAITVYRMAHLLHGLGVPLIPRMLTEWAHGRTGIDIHPGATIGPYFFIDHGTGVVIGETCEIGSWVKLYQGVTLGALSFQTDENGNLVRGTKRHPTIEDHVVIYANATVLGGQTVIGHHSVIGSSAWVTRTVQPNTTVTMDPPQLKYRGGNSDI